MDLIQLNSDVSGKDQWCFIMDCTTNWVSKTSSANPDGTSDLKVIYLRAKRRKVKRITDLKIEQFVNLTGYTD